MSELLDKWDIDRKKIIQEINAIKAERNAVIKAHADLMAECQELKMELKLCKARLGDE